MHVLRRFGLKSLGKLFRRKFLPHFILNDILAIGNQLVFSTDPFCQRWLQSAVFGYFAAKKLPTSCLQRLK